MWDITQNQDMSALFAQEEHTRILWEVWIIVISVLQEPLPLYQEQIQSVTVVRIKYQS